MHRIVVALMSLIVATSCAVPPLASPANASPTPTVTPAAVASPSPTAVAAGDRYGYVFTGGDGQDRIFVRRERDFAIVFELRGVAPAVSPDGKRLAYWRNAANAGGIVSGTDLRVLDAADPASDRSVFTPTADTLGGAVVWSNDGQGLLVATYSRETVSSPGPERGPLRYDLSMLDLASTPPATRAAGPQLSGGRVYLPVAWDRPGQIAAAIVTGPGGYATEYTTWNGNAASPFARVDVPTESGAARTSSLVLAFSVQASADAKLVMALESSRNVLRVWPILDIAKADQVRHPSIISSAVWRTGTGPTGPYEVVWAVGQKIDLFRYKTDSVTTLYTSAGNVGVAGVRPDGSAVLLAESPCCLPPPPTTRLFVIDVATRQVTEVGTQLGGSVGRGVLLR